MSLTGRRLLPSLGPRQALMATQHRQLHVSATRHGCTPGMPVMFMIDYDRRDEYGVPAVIPPEVSTLIRHTYYVPPQFYPWLKKLGDDTPELKPYMDKLINGEMTFTDYEEMFYKFA